MRASKHILSIAALDSSGGAGLSQDTRVAYLHGCDLLSCCTALTLQTSLGVEAIYPTATDHLQSTLSRMISLYPISAVKIGALVNREQIQMVTKVLAGGLACPVVLDPVLAPTHGIAFVANEDLDVYRKLLFHVDYLLPNAPELSILSGEDIHDWKDAVAVATVLAAKYSLSVIVKGGHSSSKRIMESLVSPIDVFSWEKERINLQYSHGTGCALSTAFACLLASGVDAPAAAEQSSHWVSEYYQKLNA